MNSNTRIIINTIAQYAKAVINICLSLYSTRLILEALSISDYGIYSVVGSVVAMLGFITNALVVTTQRYVSFYHGKGDISFVGKIFANSLMLHVVFGLVIGLFLILMKGWIFNGVLNIPPPRIDIAASIYSITIVTLFVTIITAPFKALFIARENIVFISAVEVCDGILKLVFAIALLHVNTDHLLTYGYMMCTIQILNLIAFAVYSSMRFEECHLRVRLADLSRDILLHLTGFAGWTIYSTGTIAARNQGTAITINHFAGTMANAAYGVAAQINAAVFFISSSIVNAMNPQIMKAEGEGNRKRVLKLANQESKYSTILLSIAAIPIITVLPEILSVWLKDVPAHSAMFCSFTLATCLVDQTTIGLNAVNRAQGKIGLYTLIMFTPKLFCLPIGWWLLSTGHSLRSIMWVIFIIEAFTAACRLPFLKATAGLDITDYLRHVLLPITLLAGSLILFSWGCTQLIHFSMRFLLILPLSALFGLCIAWVTCLSDKERHFIIDMLKSRMKHKRTKIQR